MNSVLEDTQSMSAASEDEEQLLRMQMYMLLARLLRQAPDESLLSELRQIRVQEDADASMVKAWAELRLAAEMSGGVPLEDEYFQLFIGLGRGELVPFGSWYLTGFLMERPLARLRQDLMALGYERDASVHEPEDHAAALFEVMAMMLQDGIEHERQQAFYQQHIAPWMARFMNDLMVADSASFYRSVGQLGKQFMEIEDTYFSMMT